MTHSRPSFITVAATLIVAAISTHGQATVAQQQFDGESKAESRVIQLRSQQAQDPALSQRETSSRGDRVKSNPTDAQTRAVASPDQIQFEDIQTSSPVRSQVRPVGRNSSLAVQDLAIPSTSQQIAPNLQPTPTVNPEPNQMGDPSSQESEELVSRQENMVSTEIRSPKSVNVDQPAEMRINLRNHSQEAVSNVKLIANIPDHAKFVSATPRPSRVKGQMYEFVVQRIGSKKTQQILLNVVPTEKSNLEIGTQLILENVQRTVVSVQQPELTMKISGPVQSTTGKMATHTLTIANVGDGVATDVRLKTIFPNTFRQTHSSNATVIPAIRPGASLEIPFESQALTPGKGELKIVADSKSVRRKEATMAVSVHQPELRLSAVGPKLNFVQRDGIYSIDVENTGEVEVTNVQVALSVPDGLKVTTISRQAEVDELGGKLLWSFDKLSAKSSEQIQLKATAIKEGLQVCSILVSSDETLEKEFRLSTQVTTRADLTVRIKNQTGPVQVGAKAEFLVEVENQGSRQASNIDVEVVLPESLMPIKDDQTSDGEKNALTFTEPLVEPGQKITFKFTAVGVSQGDHVVRSTLRAEGSERKVITENSVYVYDVDQTRVSESLSPVVPRR